MYIHTQTYIHAYIHIPLLQCFGCRLLLPYTGKEHIHEGVCDSVAAGENC